MKVGCKPRHAYRTSFGANLRKAREAAGATQDELATLTGIDSTTIVRYESGTREPSLWVCAMLAYQLGTTVDALIGFDLGE